MVIILFLSSSVCVSRVLRLPPLFVRKRSREKCASSRLGALSDLAQQH
jgi:hypothetical protein